MYVRPGVDRRRTKKAAASTSGRGLGTIFKKLIGKVTRKAVGNTVRKAGRNEFAFRVSVFQYAGFDGTGNYYIDRIEKFTFASEGTAANWSSLVLPSYDHGGTQSTTHGYAISGVEVTWAWTMTEIYQYSYSSESNAVVDVGDITRCMTGSSDGIAK